MLKAIKHFIKQSWLLIVASFFFGLLIAATNAAWAPRIDKNKTGKLNDLMKFLLPNAAKFKLDTKLEIKSDKGKIIETNVYTALSHIGKCTGYCFNVSGPGFADKIELVVAVDKDFEKIAGFDVLASNETPGFGDQIKQSFYRSQFAGAPAEILELVKTGDDKKIDSEIVAISGATVSSEAVVKIINNSLTQIKDQMQKRIKQ